MKNENENLTIYEQEYVPSIIKFGRVTNLIGVLFALVPGLVCYFVFGLWSGWGPIFAGFLMQASVSGVFWFVEPISYFNVLGLAGTYMAFLSGNIGNLRMPVSVAAQEAAGVQPGSEQGAVIATIGCAISVLVNVMMLTAGAILGSSVLGLLPASIIAILNNILPALFGAMFGQQVFGNPKIGGVAAFLAGCMLLLNRYGFLSFLPGSPAYAVVIVSVFGSILIGRKITEKELAALRD